MLSEHTYKKYLGNNKTSDKHEGHHPELIYVPRDESKPTGFIAYTPHACILPDPEEHPIGTVFRCTAYPEGNVCCNDLWEVQNLVNASTWVRVVPRWRQN